MSTEFAYLPPLPPIAAPLEVATAETRPPSKRGESLLVAITLLLAGISFLAWTIRLDVTESQIFVTAAASLTVIVPQAFFGVLRATSRRL